MPRQEWSFFMPAEDHKEFKWFLAYFQARLTPIGQIIFIVIMFGLAISSVGTQISAYFLPSFIIALIINSYFLSLFFKPKVKAHRLLPSPPSAGSPYTYKVVVENVDKRPIRNLSIFEQSLPFGLYANTKHPQFKNEIDWLESGEKTTLTLALKTPRRGVYEIKPLIAATSFPSGIIRATKRLNNNQRFVVYPKLIPPGNLLIEFDQTLQPGGLSSSSKIGDSNEFASTRDYRQEDRQKDIHWPSSARSNKLIVKEYIEEYVTRVGLFIDTELTKFEKHKCFENRISLCAGLAESLNAQHCVIDLFLSDEKHQHLQINYGTNHFHHLLELLSIIEGDTVVDFKSTLKHLNENSQNLTALVLFLKDWDTKRSEFVKSLNKTSKKIKVVIIRDQPTTIPVSEENITVYTSNQLKDF